LTRIVVSGFGPWGALPHNPTLAVLERLSADASLPGLVTLPMPVDTRAVDAAVSCALDRHRPALWIGLGLALGAAVVAVERVAVNVRDFVEPDIAGARPSGSPVFAEGPDAYLSTLPLALLRDRLRASGIPARVSDSAGAFLCNQLMYTVLHRVAERGFGTRAGFLHLPADPALVARLDGTAAHHPSMSIGLMAEAVQLAIAASLTAAS
jgi:pyroglutamyl-peptidase